MAALLEHFESLQREIAYNERRELKLTGDELAAVVLVIEGLKEEAKQAEQAYKNAKGEFSRKDAANKKAALIKAEMGAIDAAQKEVDALYDKLAPFDAQLEELGFEETSIDMEADDAQTLLDALTAKRDKINADSKKFRDSFTQKNTALTKLYDAMYKRQESERLEAEAQALKDAAAEELRDKKNAEYKKREYAAILADPNADPDAKAEA